MNSYVIIGNGTACVGCIEGIRSADQAGKITVISEEKHAVYCRPLISYYLEGKTDLQRMKYRGDSFYSDMGCEVLYGKKAVKIDSSAKKVILDDQAEVPFTKVCICTGSSPFVPPFKGLETVKEKFSFMTLDDALALEKAVNSDSKVLIVGAGLIGLKCAEGLKDRVKEITVCDLADRVLSSILDREPAEMMKKHLENNGIHFMLSDSAEYFDGNTAVMKSGEKINFDVLVLAVGVRANTSLAKDIGCEVDRGIVIDEKCETTVPGVFAAGDCSQGEDISFGAKRVLAILPNAYMQGFCAGKNMAGEQAVFDKGIPMNSIGFFGLHTMTAGTYYTKEQGGEMFEEKTEDSIKRLFVKDGRLTGFMLVKNTDRAGIYTSLIREKTPLESINFDLLKKITSFAAFSDENRRKKFGGMV